VGRVAYGETVHYCRAACNTKNGLAQKKAPCHVGNMETPRSLIERLGRDAIAARLDIAPRRVSNAALDAQLPASWYVTLSDMAGADLPRDMFTFKGMTKEPVK